MQLTVYRLALRLFYELTSEYHTLIMIVIKIFFRVQKRNKCPNDPNDIKKKMEQIALFRIMNKYSVFYTG